MDDIDFSSVMAKPEVEHEIVPPKALSAPPPAKKSLAKATKTAPEPAQSDERTALLTRLKVYFATFPAKLKAIAPKSLEKLSDEELQRLNEQVGLHMGAKAGVEGFALMVPNVMKVAEDVIAMFSPLRLQGTHKAFLTPEMQDLIKCACIDAGICGGLTMTPLQKIALCLMITGSQQHMMNTAIEAMTPEQRQSMAAALQAQTSSPPPPTQASTPPEDDRYANL